ncbi:MAG: hypothetical protein FWG34_03515 [Oscillospiraceae bacterium]|nr:hypothetical protein [Oscillospiraceae bacterium]
MKKAIAYLILAAVLLAMPALAIDFGANDENEGGPGVFYTFQRCYEKPAIDGKFDEYAYAKIDVQPGDVSYEYGDDDTRKAWSYGLKYDLYASYDDDYLYFFYSLEADSEARYYNEMDDGDGSIWQRSCIQVSLANLADEGGDRFEIGLGKNNFGNGDLQFVAWAQYPDAKAEFEAVGGTDFQIVRDGGKLNYELRIPVSAFYSGDKFAEGGKLRWNLVMAQGDEGLQEHIHTQISSGCTGNGKNAQYFAEITLGGIMAGPPAPEPEAAPEEPAAAPEEPAAPAPAPAEPVTPAAPTTGDSGVWFFAIAMIAAAFGFVAIRKKTAKKF